MTQLYKEVDAIIVGQGIAGTALAYRLIKGNKKVVVIDRHDKHSASRVAPGVVNPIVLKRLTTSWKAAEIIPFAEKFYRELERFTSSAFFYKVPIFRLLATREERVFWTQKAREPGTGVFMEETIQQPPEKWNIQAFDGGYIKEGAYLDTETMLNAFRQFLQQKNLLINERFEYKDLFIQPGFVQYRGIEAKKVIFCEGPVALENPFFQWLPFKLTKGEVLTIKAPGLKVDRIINRKMFLLPVGNGTYKVGATFDWEQLDTQTTEKAKNELCDKLEKVIKAPYEIIDHQAGIRPTVKDRRPLIGFHPEHVSIGVFNGMGTKGVMLAPYFADHFFQYMEGQVPALEKEVDIRRFSEYF